MVTEYFIFLYMSRKWELTLIKLCFGCFRSITQHAYGNILSILLLLENNSSHLDVLPATTFVFYSAINSCMISFHTYIINH
jgi:hypothetical protein